MDFDVISVLGLVRQEVRLLPLVQILSSSGFGLRLVILNIAAVLTLGCDAMRPYSLMLGLESVLADSLTLILPTMAYFSSLDPGTDRLVLVFRRHSCSVDRLVFVSLTFDGGLRCTEDRELLIGTTCTFHATSCIC